MSSHHVVSGGLLLRSIKGGPNGSSHLTYNMQLVETCWPSSFLLHTYYKRSICTNSKKFNVGVSKNLNGRFESGMKKSGTDQGLERSCAGHKLVLEMSNIITHIL